MEEKEVDLTSTSLDLQVPATAGKCSVKGQLWKYDVEWNRSSVMSPSLFKHPLMVDLKNILYKLSSKTEHTQLLIIRWLINLQISKFSYGIQALKLFLFHVSEVFSFNNNKNTNYWYYYNKCCLFYFSASWLALEGTSKGSSSTGTTGKFTVN